MIPSISHEADSELSEGASRYAEEGTAALGLAFVEEFERALDLLCAYPQLGTIWRRGRRRFPLRRFPYSIIYYTKGDELRVIALAHHRRRPSYWAGRK
ncbi:MAG TPA: type II toxin-antitoxin system RelE/ParE family toxin [Thermoanaerobaculia bacterium]|nr:type II toxin-antitoxin system RelE/ParE family toxin [Thermoanaerobaculia bacterium]